MIKSEIVSIMDNYPVIALAVSGGADSMAMAEWFRQNRPKDSYVIINIDHHIRGEESKRDSDFVSDFAKKYGIKLYRYDIDCLSFAKQNGYTIEQAARILRHQIFEQAAAEYAYVVATAHHMSDQAESVFMHIARGTGIGGLMGMSVLDGHIFRPLLHTSKAEILEFIKVNRITYCQDSSNNDNAYSRNYTRNAIMPSVMQKYPTFDKSLIKLAERAREIADFIDTHTPTLIVENGGVYCDFKDKHKVIKAEMIKRAFSLLGVTADIEERHIEAIIDFAKSTKSGSLDMPYNTIVYKEENGVTTCKKLAFENKTYRFSEGCFEIGGFELRVQKVKKNKLKSMFAVCENGLEKTLYIATDNFESLDIRLRQNGDKIQKFGGGSKSLGDFLTDKKVPLRFRDRLPVVADGKNVVCVCGVEISECAKVLENSENTFKINITSII